VADILITGGAGFVGGNFVRYWRARHPGDAILVLDRLTEAGNPETIDDIDGVTLIVGDICDTRLVETLLRDRRIDRLVHFAAETRSGSAEILDRTNVAGTKSLLQAAQQVWLDEGSGRPHRFHHVSTAGVYGSLGPDDPPFTEASPHAPSSPFAASKADSDRLVGAWHESCGLEVTIGNCTNNYGPYQAPDRPIPLFLANALSNRLLPLHGDGMHLRDWLHVEDHCRAIELMLERGRPGETYNLGSGVETANLDLVRSLCRWVDAAFARDAELAQRFPFALAARGEETLSAMRFVEDRAGHDRRYAIDPAKARGELGFAPQHDFATGLDETLQWYLDNEHWWLPLLSR
jgi:dTDP-glucose 4,6-dehydratase